MVNISIPVAFLAGLASFFAPCVLPLLPSYISYITGVSILDSNKAKCNQRKIIISSLFYVLGFSLIFVAFGFTAGGISYYLRHNYQIIQQIGGAVIVLFGLELLGIINLTKNLNKINPISLAKFDSVGYTRSFVFGVVFSLSWTPCVGVILGSILALAGTTGTAYKGAMLLFVYSLGISIPFLLISIFLSTYKKYMFFINKYSLIVTKVTSVVLIVFGLMLATNSYKYFNGFIYNLSNTVGWSSFLVNNL